MRNVLEYFRTTVIGGAVFVLPLLLAYFIITKAIQLFGPMVRPLVTKLGIETFIGAAAGTIVTLLSLVLAAFLFGVFAHSRIGQSLLKWMQAGIVSALPRFHLLQGVAESLDHDQGKEIPVVLVPTDAGWALALQLEERHGDWCTVFIPGSPQWTSGSVAFAHIDDVHPVDMPLGRSLMMMRRCGMGSAQICDILTQLKSRGSI
jgi:uncharacterized membrane protein